MISGLFIAIPTQDNIHIQTALSLCGIVSEFSRQGLPHTVRYYSSADIVRSRNKLAAAFLAETQYSHILFVDSDVAFDPRVFNRLAEIDAPFVAAACPKRTLDLDKLRRAIEAEAGKSAKKRAPTSELVSRVSSYNIRVVGFDGKPWTFVERGSNLSVPAVGFGVVLLSREVFTTMMEKGCVEPADPDGEAYPAETSFGFFDPIRSQTSKGWMSEDYSFCKRWVVECGGEIWVNQASTIRHIGDYHFSATLSEKMKAIEKQPATDELH